VSVKPTEGAGAQEGNRDREEKKPDEKKEEKAEARQRKRTVLSD
jgi:hypothetical protein